MAYNEESKTKIFNDICDLIASGKSLRSSLKKFKLSSQTFFIWLREDEIKSKQYARATEIRALMMFEEMIDIANTPKQGTTEKLTEKGVEIRTGDMLGHRRLQIDTMKWGMMRLAPKKYSERAVQLTAEKPEDADSNEFLLKTIQLRDSIIEKHYRHFKKFFDWTIWKGGSRSGKTYNVLLSAYLETRQGRWDCSLIAPSHKMLEFGMFADMKRILSEYAPDIHIPERPTKLNLHGSIWNFEVVTSENEAKRNRDNVIVDEADAMPELIANLLGRAKGRKFVMFNPVKKFWAEDKINESETNILESSWQDNKHLTENQLQWFADLKKNGEFAEDGSPEKYAYDVYYLGNYSLLSGKAYELSDFDLVDEVPEKFDYMISYSDPSLGVGADYFASLLFGIKNNIVYALDCIFSQFTKIGGYVEQLNAWDSQYGKIIDHYAENNGTSGVVTRAAKEVYNGVLSPVSNGDNKAADIIVYCTTAKKFKYVRSAKMLSFIEQCVDFPNNEHDDAPDCLARGAKILMKNFDI